HWQKQRALLLEVCEDIKDSDVIESDSKLSPLTELLKRVKNSKKPFDDLKAIITARRSEINKELDKIPVRISEVTLGLPNITGLSSHALKGDIEAYETSINEKKLTLQGIDTGGKIAELSKTLAGVNSDIQRVESAHYTETMKGVNRLNQEITEKEDSVKSTQRRITSLQREIKSKEDAIANIEKNLAILREKWASVDEEKFNYPPFQDTTTTDTCP